MAALLFGSVKRHDVGRMDGHGELDGLPFLALAAGAHVLFAHVNALHDHAVQLRKSLDDFAAFAFVLK